ncbi:MAG: Rrf2 family transcriptional regulator [Phycisphaerales bacterium]|nr:Rrf2 family transcriptional regulator [Phycisphaerales bacterium]
MISMSSEYALKALVFLTRLPDQGPATAQRIASEMGIPRKYLSRILRELVTAEVLTASPGRAGGFRLNRDPRTLRLAEVVEPFEQFLGARSGCPFDNKSCDGTDPCAGHRKWSELRTRLQTFLKETSIQEIAIHASDSNGKSRH